MHCVGRNDMRSSTGSGTRRDIAKSAQVRAESRLMVADGIAVSEEVKVLDQG